MLLKDWEILPGTVVYTKEHKATDINKIHRRPMGKKNNVLMRVIKEYLNRDICHVYRLETHYKDASPLIIDLKIQSNDN